MSDALPLPSRPNLEQYRKLAKDLQKACKSSAPDAVRVWIARWVETVARLQGLESTKEVRRQIDFDVDRIARRWQEFRKSNENAARCALTGAQFFIGREHGFASWPRFAAHLEALAQTDSTVSKFEAAVDAVVAGDIKNLERLLRESPDLVRERSTREHRSTLLHYVSANGVEDYRQKTPENIVEIARLLLDAGADVNAESDAYGGRSTTLGLTATSIHPERAGVQIPLMELLIERGAAIDGPDGSSAVNACLHNGRGAAAEFLAQRGARLDLEGGAGVGRLDIVRGCFDGDGRLKPPSTQKQLSAAYAWACEFGRSSVVEFLLDSGIAVDMKVPHDGETGLHWAALGGHPEIVRLLLERGAPIDVRDDTYGGTPLEWALYAWGNSSGEASEKRGSYGVVALLVQAGAKPDPRWFQEPGNFGEKLRADPLMLAALRGKMPQD